MHNPNEFPATFYWYDYESFGLDPKRSGPSQFAGRRTDLSFNPVAGEEGEGEVFYCKPSHDRLPSPESCLLTGITPQQCEAEGLKETDFAEKVWERLNTPGTVSLGYNTLGFDDEVNRFLFWRNFLEPYTHSWAKGCSRWDIFPLVCACWALRGDTIKWPQWEEIDPAEYPKAAGRSGVCFKLEFLTKANGIVHSHAHDALSDVEATIGMAKLIAEREPRLWKWAFENRDTKTVLKAVEGRKPVVWVSPRFGVKRGCTGIVACFHQEKNDCWMWDLTEDPTVLGKLTAEEFRRRMFPTAEEKKAGVERLPLRLLKANAAPFVCANLKVLSPARAERHGIDLSVIQGNLEKLLAVIPMAESAFAELLAGRFDGEPDISPDPDASLYSSGFTSKDDKVRFRKIRAASPLELKTMAEAGIPFDDPQFSELLLRYRARNFPETLSVADQEYWTELCRRRLLGGADGSLALEEYFEFIDQAGASGQYDNDAHQDILGALYEWGEMLGESVSS